MSDVQLIYLSRKIGDFDKNKRKCRTDLLKSFQDYFRTATGRFGRINNEVRYGRRSKVDNIDKLSFTQIEKDQVNTWIEDLDLDRKFENMNKFLSILKGEDKYEIVERNST